MTRPTILCTAFEPSGDHHGAALIRSLLSRAPDLRIMAMGGPLMQQAGAELIETTTEKAVMLHGAAGQVMAHRARVKRLHHWLTQNHIDMLIPVDSPAANWAICKAVRQTQPTARIVHLVAPQLWAWAPWRIRRLKRLSDHVLCLLPFEPDWFSQRGMPATFVGHPMFDALEDHPAPDDLPADLPTGELRLALLPGSRPGEILKNWPTMQAAFARLKQQHPELVGLIAAREASAVQQIHAASQQAGPWPEDLHLIESRTPEVIQWAQVVLVVSGTASLQVAFLQRPMVVLFNVNWWMWQMLGRWLIQTRTFTLPNLIHQWQTGRHAVPELVPHFGQVEPVVEQVHHLLSQPAARQQQCSSLEQIGEPFAGIRFRDAAAEAVLTQLAAR